MADTALTPFDAGTFGSRTTPTMTPQFRRVASAARDLLIGVAAKEWNVAPEGLVAADAKVTDPASKRSLSYAELARGKALTQNLPAEDPVTPAAEWKIAGKSIPKVDGRAFVTGSHQYASDIRLEGMLYGKVLRPPSFGATLISYDDSVAKAMNGVVIVRDGDFVGAAARSEHEAQAALEAIRAQWKEVPQISNKEIFSYLKKNAEATTNDRFRKQKGSVDEGLAGAAHRLDATYNVAYIAHAPLEPRAAVAEWKDGKLTVWTGTQRPFANRDELADVFHIPESNVRVIVPDTGSAYGGKHTSDAAIEAARLARAAGRPVKVVWTREEEFTWAYFRPAGVIEVKGGITADGKLTAWEFHNYHSGMSAIETPYVVANQHAEYHAVPLVLRSGSYRGLAATANHFARETHMERASGAVRVVRVVEAFECGAIVNPDGLRNQVVGAIIQGLGGALFEAVEFENGRIKNSHFATYRVPRFRDVPEIEAILIDRKDIPSAGAGETPIMAVAPAIGNAIYHATGIRLNNLPMAPNGVRSN
jgi:isoquinoline 1-oxidoreductase